MNVRSINEDAKVARYKFHKNVTPFQFYGEGLSQGQYFKQLKFTMDGREHIVTLNSDEQRDLRELLIPGERYDTKVFH